MTVSESGTSVHSALRDVEDMVSEPENPAPLVHRSTAASVDGDRLQSDPPFNPMRGTGGGGRGAPGPDGEPEASYDGGGGTNVAPADTSLPSEVDTPSPAPPEDPSLPLPPGAAAPEAAVES